MSVVEQTPEAHENQLTFAFVAQTEATSVLHQVDTVVSALQLNYGPTSHIPESVYRNMITSLCESVDKLSAACTGMFEHM